METELLDMQQGKRLLGLLIKITMWGQYREICSKYPRNYVTLKMYLFTDSGNA